MLHVLEDIVTNCSRAVLGSMHTRISFRSVITEIWNALPSAVVEASSLNVFKRMLDSVDC